MMWELDEREPAIRFLIRDNDKKFSHAFDTVFLSAGIKVIPTPCGTPNANAYAERWIRSVREESLDKVLIIHQAHLRCVMRQYIAFFYSASASGLISRFLFLSKPSSEWSGAVSQCSGVSFLTTPATLRRRESGYP
jgi:hypothetical protein